MLKLSIYLIIAIFSVILREYLSSLSLIMVLLSAVTFFSKKTLNQISINILCLIIFSYYLINYGKVISPEVGINFLLNVVLLKFMESKKFRDEVMCIFGTILLISAGSLFDKTLVYLFFFSFSFLILVQLFFKLNGLSLLSLRNSKSYLKLSCLIIILFFIFPRIPNPIPFTLNSKGKGEIGYSPEINISSIEKLVENDATAFWVKLNEERPREELYWRGNTVSITDGWNWNPGNPDQGILEKTKGNEEILQEYRLLIKSPYFFVYDGPVILVVNNQSYKSDQSNIFNSSYIKNPNRYFTQKGQLLTQISSEDYLKTNLSTSEREWIRSYFKNSELNIIVEEYRKLLLAEDFRYTWTPGVISSLQEFMKKRVGFCTHYASSLALILRELGHPTRIVSGFQGGRFNPYGKFYEITQNDAHAWVEVHDGEKWLRIDPTAFIAPERIVMDYQEVVNNNFVLPSEALQKNSFLSEMQFILGQWDFEFYQLMDQWDANVQLSFFSQFKLTRSKLWALCSIIVSLFLFLFLRRKKQTPLQKEWNKFLERLGSHGLIFQGSFDQLAQKLAESPWEKKQQALVILNLFVESFYGQRDHRDQITKKLQDLNQ